MARGSPRYVSLRWHYPDQVTGSVSRPDTLSAGCPSSPGLLCGCRFTLIIADGRDCASLGPASAFRRSLAFGRLPGNQASSRQSRAFPAITRPPGDQAPSRQSRVFPAITRLPGNHAPIRRSGAFPAITRLPGNHAPSRQSRAYPAIRRLPDNHASSRQSGVFPTITRLPGNHAPSRSFSSRMRLLALSPSSSGSHPSAASLCRAASAQRPSRP